MTSKPQGHRPSTSVRHPMPEEMLEAAADRFRALSETGRLRLLEFLCLGPKSVTELAEATGQSHANASKHLAVLASAGFVERKREGNRVLYRLTDDTTVSLCSVICDHVVRTAEADLAKIRPARR